MGGSASPMPSEVSAPSGEKLSIQSTQLCFKMLKSVARLCFAGEVALFFVGVSVLTAAALTLQRHRH